jgi:hypothetical protein
VITIPRHCTVAWNFRKTPEDARFSDTLFLRWEWLATDMEHGNSVVNYREENSIDMRFTAIEELPHFERKPRIFGSEWTESSRC